MACFNGHMCPLHKADCWGLVDCEKVNSHLKVGLPWKSGSKLHNKRKIEAVALSGCCSSYLYSVDDNDNLKEKEVIQEEASVVPGTLDESAVTPSKSSRRGGARIGSRGSVRKSGQIYQPPVATWGLVCKASMYSCEISNKRRGDCTLHVCHLQGRKEGRAHRHQTQLMKQCLHNRLQLRLLQKKKLLRSGCSQITH